MADYGMTPKGFVPKRLAEIMSDINAEIADIVDPATGEFPFANATDDSILQQVVAVFGNGLAQCWTAAYEGSVQFDPLKNTGAGQSGTVQLNAIQRKEGAPTILEMRLSGSAGTVILEGSRIANSTLSEVYEIREDVTIGVDGYVNVAGYNLASGPQDPDADTIVFIQPQSNGTTIAGWTGATNVSTISVGTYEETDEELRVRQQRSTTLTSYRIIDALYAAVFNVPGVIFVRAYQNASTDPEDERGIPFKEFAVIAEGGDQREIAEAIFLRVPTGQLGVGTITEVFNDAQGQSYPISFSRPIEVPIYVSIELRVKNAGVFPDNYEDFIRTYILQYAQYGVGADTGFPPGENIIRTRLYTPINEVPGHSIVSVLIGTTESVSDVEEIAIEWNQVGRFAADRITVTLVS